MSPLRPIETLFAGCRFRSRLEARWCAAFDVMGIPWEYEPEGFHLPSGRLYLPDFMLMLPKGPFWVEIKPDGGDISLFEEFIRNRDDERGTVLGYIPDIHGETCVSYYHQAPGPSLWRGRRRYSAPRTSVAAEMRERFREFTDPRESGPRRKRCSTPPRSQRALWLEYWLRQQERQLADGAPFDAAKWTQGANSLQGIFAKLGLERRARDVGDLQSDLRLKEAAA